MQLTKTSNCFIVLNKLNTNKNLEKIIELIESCVQVEDTIVANSEEDSDVQVQMSDEELIDTSTTQRLSTSKSAPLNFGLGTNSRERSQAKTYSRVSLDTSEDIVESPSSSQASGSETSFRNRNSTKTRANRPKKQFSSSKQLAFPSPILGKRNVYIDCDEDPNKYDFTRNESSNSQNFVSQPPAKRKKTDLDVKDQTRSLTEITKSNSFVGRWWVKVKQVREPIDTRPGEWNVRQIDRANLVELTKNFRRRPDGVYCRQDFRIVIVKGEYCKPGCFEEFEHTRQKLLESDADPSKIAELCDYCRGVGTIDYIVIGGRHSRQVYLKLINSTDEQDEVFTRDWEIPCSFYTDLTKNETICVARADNEVKAGMAESDGNRMLLIHSAYLEEKNISYKTGIPTDFVIKCISNYILDPDAWNRLSEKDRGQKLNTYRGFVRGACWPAEFDDLMTGIATKVKLSMVNIAALLWTKLDWDALRVILKEALTTKDNPNKRFSKAIERLKKERKLLPSIVEVYNFWKDRFKVELSTDDFLQIFFSYYPFDTCVTRYKSNLQMARGRKKKAALESDAIQTFKSEDLVHDVRHVLREISDSGAAGENEVVVTNGSDQKSKHWVFNWDLHDFFHAAKKDDMFINDNVKLIFFDPPFGILTNQTWDSALTDDYVDTVFESCRNLYPSAIIVIFIDIESVPRYMTSATKNGYSVDMFTRLKPFQPSTAKTVTHCAVPILLCTTKTRIEYVRTDKGLKDTSVFNNFLISPRIRDFYKINDTVVNRTEKPIDLYRAFMFNHASSPCTVIDLCSGSGACALAAATLGYNSVSVDIRESQTDATKQRLAQYNGEPGQFAFHHPQHVFSINALVKHPVSYRSSQSKNKKKNEIGEVSSPEHVHFQVEETKEQAEEATAEDIGSSSEDNSAAVSPIPDDDFNPEKDSASTDDSDELLLELSEDPPG